MLILVMEVNLMDIIITAKEIKGHCPTFKVGDAFTLKAGYQLVSDIPVCMPPWRL